MRLFEFFAQKIRLPRFERGTLCLEGRCSIQLSYRRISCVVLNLLHAHRVSFSVLRTCQLHLFAIRHECHPQIRYSIVKFLFSEPVDLPLRRQMLYPAELQTHDLFATLLLLTIQGYHINFKLQYIIIKDDINY